MSCSRILQEFPVTVLWPNIPAGPFPSLGKTSAACSPGNSRLGALGIYSSLRGWSSRNSLLKRVMQPQLEPEMFEEAELELSNKNMLFVLEQLGLNCPNLELTNKSLT